MHDRAALERQVAAVIAHYRQPALVERYIEGREIYVSMLGRRDGATQISAAARDRFLGDAGRTGRASSPSTASGTRARRVPRHEAGAVRGLSAPSRRPAWPTVARSAFAAMELRDYGRLDIRLAADGTPYVIDVNPNCDLSEPPADSPGPAAPPVSVTMKSSCASSTLPSRAPPCGYDPSCLRSRAARRHRLAGSGLPARRRSSCAIELLAAALAPAEGDTYEARSPPRQPTRRPRPPGYACFGPTPMTEAAFDLYWLVGGAARAAAASAPRCPPPSSKSSGSAAPARARRDVSLEGQGGARRFYEKTGFRLAGAIANFYKEGDDLLVFAKVL